MRWWWLVAVGSTGLAALGWTDVAQAGQPSDSTSAEVSASQKREAGKHFRAGVKAFRQRQYPEAAEEFEKANEIAPHPATLWNAADAWDKAGDLTRAATLYEQYLKVAPEKARDRREARLRLDRLYSQLGHLELAGKDVLDVSVDGVSSSLGSHLVEPGKHKVQARIRGQFVERIVTVVAGQSLRLVLEPDFAPDPTPAAPPPEPDKSSKGLSPAYVYVGAGVTAVLAGLTVASGLDTRSKRNDYDAHPSADLYDEGVAAQKRTNIMLGVTAALGVTTAAIGLFAVQWDKDKKATVGLGPSSAYVHVRF